MRKKTDLRKQKFGRLTAIKIVEKTKSGNRWLCSCECGNKTIVVSSELRRGSTKSCGCLRKELSKIKSTTHGLSYTPEYVSWCRMRSRCLDKSHSKYKDYGGRGITVCERWLDMKNFYLDMGKRPDGLTLERINNDKGYSPDNCEWATMRTQCHNRRAQKRNKTGVAGINWLKKAKRYNVHIGVDDELIYLGSFNNLIKAKEARMAGEEKYWQKIKLEND